MDWTEGSIARALALGPLKGRKLIVVPNCSWTGYECDLLVIDEKLRIIDVEIKISRSDFRADAKKDKWWHRRSWADEDRTLRLHPHRVYKHYYAMPAAIWKDEMLTQRASPKSGVILLRPAGGGCSADLHVRAAPNKDARPLSAGEAIDVARLSAYRLWELTNWVAAQRQRRIRKEFRE